MSDIKLCVDCKYFSSRSTVQINNMCKHTEHLSVVDGGAIWPCSEMRYKGECGTEAKLFEAKVTLEVKQTESWLNMFFKGAA